jgi:hypothetical protein
VKKIGGGGGGAKTDVLYKMEMARRANATADALLIRGFTLLLSVVVPGKVKYIKFTGVTCLRRFLVASE